MRRLLLVVGLVALAAASACQTRAHDHPNGSTYSKSGANKARTDDPIGPLQRY